jgi:hypothetical protein
MQVGSEVSNGGPSIVVSVKSGEGKNWLNMDQVGWIQFTSDGEQMWREVERR